MDNVEVCREGDYLLIRVKLALAITAVAACATGLGFYYRAGHAANLTAAETAVLLRRVPAGMRLVPSGDCWIGSNDEDADEDTKPMRRVYVPSFAIDAREVTNAEFQHFDPSYLYPAGSGTKPATNITYAMASAYAAWAGKRLPTEQEWEKAARGTDGRRYPWGNTWDPGRVARRAGTHGAQTVAVRKTCALGPQRVQPTGSVPGGVSVYGCYDMAGNAWEWVEGVYAGDPSVRVLRGGAVGYGERACRTYVRSLEPAGGT